MTIVQYILSKKQSFDIDLVEILKKYLNLDSVSKSKSLFGCKPKRTLIYFVNNERIKHSGCRNE